MINNKMQSNTSMKVISPTNVVAANGVRDSYKSQSHGIWNCDYHIIIVPRYRKHLLFVPIANEIVVWLKKLALRKDCQVLTARIDRDHIYLKLSIPPKLAVTSAIQYLKVGSSMKINEKYSGTRQKTIVNDSFWSRGYCVATDGIGPTCIERFTEEQWEIDQFFDGPFFELDWNISGQPDDVQVEGESK